MSVPLQRGGLWGYSGLKQHPTRLDRACKRDLFKQAQGKAGALGESVWSVQSQGSSSSP